jgi:HEAT repeat protein
LQQLLFLRELRGVLMKTRGRRRRPVLTCCVAAALVVMAAATYAGRDAILERWYLHQLDSPDLEVRKHAIERLGKIGSDKAVPRLIEIARADDDLGPRAVAALVRGREKAPPELLSLLEEKPEDYRIRSVAAIERDGSLPAGMSALLTIALPADLKARRCVKDAMVRMGDAALPLLKGALCSQDTRLRLQALLAMEKLPLAPEQRVEVLDRCLEDPEARVRMRALWHAAEWGYLNDDRAVPHVLHALEGDDEENRWLAVQVSSRLEAHASTLVPALLTILDGPMPGDAVVGMSGRARALRALASLAGDEPWVRKRILEALEDGEPWIRLDALQAIAVLDKKDEILHEALIRALEERGPIANVGEYNLVRWEAAKQLVALGKTDLVFTSLKSPDARIRHATLMFLNIHAVPGARKAVEAALIEEKDEKLAEYMRRALGRLSE